MFTYSIAKTTDEKKQSGELVTQTYLKQGYLPADNTTGENTIADIVSKANSITILARQENEPALVGTATLVLDSKVGLPMDVIFKDEVDTIRSKENQIAEVCQLAITHEGESKSKFDINLDLFAHTLACCIKKEVSALCFTVNPKHQSFYELLGCLQLGDQRSYPLVNKNPAIAFYMNIAELMENLENQPAFIKESLQKKPSEKFLTSI